jgi:hypothetical protein
MKSPLRLKKTLLCVLCANSLRPLRLKKNNYAFKKESSSAFKKNAPLRPLRLKKNPHLSLKRTLLCVLCG